MIQSDDTEERDNAREQLGYEIEHALEEYGFYDDGVVYVDWEEVHLCWLENDISGEEALARVVEETIVEMEKAGKDGKYAEGY